MQLPLKTHNLSKDKGTLPKGKTLRNNTNNNTAAIYKQYVEIRNGFPLRDGITTLLLAHVLTLPSFSQARRTLDARSAHQKERSGRRARSHSLAHKIQLRNPDGDRVDCTRARSAHG